MTGHKYETTPVVAGLAWWSGLDQATQVCVLSAVAAAGAMQRKMVAASGAELKPTMEAEGTVFAEADKTGPDRRGALARHHHLAPARAA